MPLSEPELISKLKEHLAEARIVQKDLAKALGYSQGHVSKIISGRHRLCGKSRLRIERLLTDHETGLSEGCEPPEAADLIIEGRKIMHNMQKWLSKFERLCASLERP